ncbi:low temperature requirement protein A [Curtobacterium sp. Csp1]|nr:low temperature requirement protein A [Curtobacterium sp. csp3]QKS22124.1 low temperature requirement protein A [Curtobacterium sp. Csp1]
MTPRDPDQHHRAASPLELLFDLVFVVAVGFAASNLHEIEAEGHVTSAVLSYALVFFAIWWAWINFSWFATSFDTDDWAYRLTTFVQMAGVLVLAAGVRDAMVDGVWTTAVAGYVVMRLALVAQWLRAAGSAPAYRRTALRYAGGIVVVQALWVGMLLLPHAAVPFVAPVLVLLEGLVASASAVIDALRDAEHVGSLLVLAGCGLVVVAGLWWIYFSREQHAHIRSLSTALVFGYGHYLVFAAAGALPAGIEVAVGAATGDADLSHTSVAATVTVPVALFVLAIWALALRPSLRRAGNAAVVLLALAVLAATAVPAAALVLTALCVAATVVVLEVADRGR